MTVFLNGAPHATQAANVILLVTELAQVPETLLIEHNGLALHRSEWPETLLQEGDQLQFLRVAAGG